MDLTNVDIDNLTNEELAELALELKAERDAVRAQRAAGEAAASASAGGQPLADDYNGNAGKPAVQVTTTSPTETSLSPVDRTHKLSASDVPETDDQGVPLLPDDRWALLWQNVREVDR